MSSILESLDSQSELPLELPHRQNDEESGPKLEEKRNSPTLWRSPTCTLNYFVKELVLVSSELITRLLAFWKTILLTILVFLLVILVLHIIGPHQWLIQTVYKEIKWCLYWLGLGVLSSVGLGTGLHTFLLYLGPHIASVTFAVYECDSLNFPEPPYPDQIICPGEEICESFERSSRVSFWSIMQKVMVESIMWGAGTALGELPPYLMTRAVRLSGDDSEEVDDLKEFEELEIKSKQDPNSMTIFEKIKLSMEQIVQRVGFFGSLACASFPNPLFDLVGIICGHFLVPFWTFFGATLLGRAIIKMMLQCTNFRTLIIIIMFNEMLIESTSDYLSYVPVIGDHLRSPLAHLLITQKRKLHERDVSESSSSKLSMIFELVVPAMVIYFILSIINLMAQRYQKRLDKQSIKEKAKTE